MYCACSIVNSKVTNDKVTLTLTIIMLLWRNGADPMISYKLGEKDIYPIQGLLMPKTIVPLLATQ